MDPAVDNQRLAIDCCVDVRETGDRLAYRARNEWQVAQREAFGLAPSLAPGGPRGIDGMEIDLDGLQDVGAGRP